MALNGDKNKQIKSIMEVKEAKRKIKIAESAIEKILFDLQDETDLLISDIRFNIVDLSTYTSKQQEVRIEIKVTL